MDDTKVRSARRYYLTITYNDDSSQVKLYKPIMQIDKESEQYPNAKKYINALVESGSIQLFDGKTIDDIKDVQISYKANNATWHVGLLFLEDSGEFIISDDGTKLLNAKSIEEGLKKRCDSDHKFLRNILNEYTSMSGLPSIKYIAISIEDSLDFGEDVKERVDKFIFTILRRKVELPTGEVTYREDYGKFRKYFFLMKLDNLEKIRIHEEEIAKEEAMKKAQKMYLYLPPRNHYYLK